MATSDPPVDPLDSPSPPTSPEDGAISPLGGPFAIPTSPRATSTRAASASVIPPPARPSISTTSMPLGPTDAARRPPGAPLAGRTGSTPMNANSDIAARMRAFHLSREGPATPQPGRGPSMSGAIAGGVGGLPSPGGQIPAGFPSNFRLPPQVGRPGPHLAASSPAVPGAGSKGLSMAERRGIKLPGGLPGAAAPGAPAGRKNPGLKLSAMNAGAPANGDGSGVGGAAPAKQTDIQRYADFIDTQKGALTFKGKATVHGQGIDFASGKSFSISLDEVDRMDELGKGNYGTVYKVRHARPKFRKQGLGLAGIQSRAPGEEGGYSVPTPISPTRASSTASAETPTNATAAQAHGRGGPTGIVMAMKEMRLELDDAKFQSIIMELDILHRCISPYIVDFYGAFFQEGAVYICMEWMDGGSIDKLYHGGVPEGVLRKITYAAVRGLKSLKEEHNIIHRDVKPTNILANTRGQVKICDFGVSGNLVASIAKTNIGCQSYMAPERISSGGTTAPGGGVGAGAVGTYSVQSDIWSLGLTIIECALGRYPYPPETYDNIFSQLSAIVDGEPPDLPADDFSPAARDFVAGCLNKIPNLRPTYPMLLQHAWLAPLDKPATILEEEDAADDSTDAPTPAKDDSAAAKTDGDFIDREVGEWVIEALERKRSGKVTARPAPALHAAPLDATATPATVTDGPAAG